MTGAVVYILRNTSGVYSLIGGTAALARAYPVFAPATVVYPYIIVEQDGDNPSDTKSGASKMDQGIINVAIFGSSYESAIALADAVHTVLDRYSGTITSGTKSWTIQSIQYLETNEDIDTRSGDDGAVMIEQLYKVREAA